jgi:hypothetical protein
MSTIDDILAACRRDPDGTRVRYRINSGKWKTGTGHEFLALWEQPFAGPVEIDHAVVLPEDAS